MISDLPLEGEAIWETGFRSDPMIFEGCEQSIAILLKAIELLAYEVPSC